MTVLSTLGIVHTLIALVAVCAALIGFARQGRIPARQPLGWIYIAFTVLSCVTSLGIYAHGSFGKPHALAILTLFTLFFAAAAPRVRLFGAAAPAVETVAYSATVLFHLIPAATETLTRLPRSAPVFDSPEASGLQLLTGLLFVCFLAGAWYQVRRLRHSAGTGPDRAHRPALDI